MAPLRSETNRLQSVGLFLLCGVGGFLCATCLLGKEAVFLQRFSAPVSVRDKRFPPQVLHGSLLEPPRRACEGMCRPRFCSRSNTAKCSQALVLAHKATTATPTPQSNTFNKQSRRTKQNTPPHKGYLLPSWSKTFLNCAFRAITV